MCNAWNHSFDCECGFGGDATGGGGFYGFNAIEPEPSWGFDTLDQCLTYNTTCWWCGEPVFFHRDESGGCALFDEIGPPWPLHPCWEEYREQQLSSVRSQLISNGFDGRFYKPSGKMQTKPLKNALNPEIQGYVANNHIWYKEPKKVYIRSARGSSSAPLIKLEIAWQDNKIFTFLMPFAKADLIGDYEIVLAKGQWIRRGRRWLLFAEEIWMRSINKKDRSIKGMELSEPLTCRFCSRDANETLWGFDQDYQVECDICGRARGKMAPNEFVEFCNRIVTGNKRSAVDTVLSVKPNLSRNRG